MHIVLFSFLIKRTYEVNIHTFFKSSSLLFSNFGLRDKLYPGGEREKSNIHHRQIAKRNKVMTSRFSKLKCDLHGKYQAPLEPLLQFCIWRNVKKKQDKNKVKHRLIFLSVLFHYFFHWFKKPKTRDLEKLCSTTQTEHKPLIALITWCLQNQDVHYGKVSCLWKRENNYKLMRANMMNLK